MCANHLWYLLTASLNGMFADIRQPFVDPAVHFWQLLGCVNGNSQDYWIIWLRKCQFRTAWKSFNIFLCNLAAVRISIPFERLIYGSRRRINKVLELSGTLNGPLNLSSAQSDGPRKAGMFADGIGRVYDNPNPHQLLLISGNHYICKSIMYQ